MSVKELLLRMSLKRCRGENITASDEKKDYKRSIIKEQTHATQEAFFGLWILPIHILYDILSRLPVDAIFTCRCVCKTFLEILLDSYFFEILANKTPSTDPSLIIQDKRRPSNMSLVRLFELGNLSLVPSLKFRVPAFLSKNKMTSSIIVGSCNGLICLSHLESWVTNFYICNPILGELFFVPCPRRSYKIQPAGFGFCPKTKKYKFVRFVYNLPCEIYTLGNDNWRTIDNVPLPKCFTSFDTSFNGNLHWVTESSSVENLICSLDLETEQFGYVSPPGQFFDFFGRMFSTRVGTLGGIFCVYYLIDRIQFEVWVMKEYGVRETWVKKYSIDISYSFGSLRANPIRLLDEGTLLLFISCNPLISYNLEKGTHTYIIAEVIGAYDAIVHVPSFISLKYIVKSEKLYVVKRKRLGCFWSGNKLIN